MNIKKSLLVPLLLLIISLMALMALLVPVSAAEQQATVDRQSAHEAIESAKQDMRDMQGAGFSVKKVNDTIVEAENLYDVQVILEQKEEKVDYSGVIKKANSVGEIKKDAFETHDALRALQLKLEDAGKSQDMSAAIEIFNEAKKEFEDERYEQTREVIDRCHRKINELQAALTKIKAIYEAGTKTLGGFFERNYKVIIATVLVVLLLYFIFRDKIAVYLVKRDMQRLQLEKETLAEMIKKAQFDYFQKGSMSESMYIVRETKFGELTRDIERRLSIERLKLENIRKKKGERVEKLRKVTHGFGLYRTKGQIRKAKEREKEKAERKMRKKLRVKLARNRAKRAKEEKRKLKREKGIEKQRKKEAKKTAKLRKKEEAERRKKEATRKKELKKEQKAKEKAREKKEKEERKRLERIKPYIQKTKSKGFSDNQIKTELARRGWQSYLINKAFSEVEEKEAQEKADYKRVKGYIQKTKSMGLADSRIKAELRKGGWKAALVKKVLREVKKESRRRKKEEKRRLRQEKKQEKRRLREEKKRLQQEKKQARKKAKPKKKEERIRLKKENARRTKEKEATKKEEARKRKEEARRKAKAVRLAEHELAIRQKEKRKQEKLARKKAIKRLREVKKEFEHRKKEALKRKKWAKTKGKKK